MGGVEVGTETTTVHTSHVLHTLEVNNKLLVKRNPSIAPGILKLAVSLFLPITRNYL
jgi:hypothetical protein